MKTRVLHIAWDGHSGGTQRYIDGLLRGPDWEGGDFEHGVALFTEMGDQIDEGSPYPVSEIGIRSGFALWKARGLGRVVDDFDPAILHVHCDTPAFLLQAGRFAKAGRKIIYTEHGDCFARDRRRLAQTWCWGRSEPHWTAIVANSEFARQTLVAEVPEFEGRSRVLANPILDEVPARPERKPGRFRIGGLGRLEPIKGFDLLIEAAALIKDEHDFDITLYGEGAGRGELERLVADCEMGDRVQLPGYTRNPILALAEFDLVVIPSRREAFGLVAIEAQSVGTPVVVTEVGGLTERVDPGRTGFRVPAEDPRALADAMVRMIGDPEGREVMAEAARVEVVRDYALATHIEELQGIYVSARG